VLLLCSESSTADTRHAPPKHIAVIMDGNRRYGKAAHGDPLKVCTAMLNVILSEVS
jgi:undecaprenyl pyrophosphate synthase